MSRRSLVWLLVSAQLSACSILPSDPPDSFVGPWDAVYGWYDDSDWELPSRSTRVNANAQLLVYRESVQFEFFDDGDAQFDFVYISTREGEIRDDSTSYEGSWERKGRRFDLMLPGHEEHPELQCFRDAEELECSAQGWMGWVFERAEED